MKPICLLIACVVPASVQGASSYYRFEGTDSAITADSGTNGFNLTAVSTVSQVALPASGNGSTFPDPVPQNNLPNDSASSFTGTTARYTAPDNAFYDDITFSAEAFISSTNIGAATKTIAAHWDSSASNQRSWLFGLGNTNSLSFLYSTSGTSATQFVIDSGFVLNLNTDYYVAVTVNMADLTTGGITFYVQNLTLGTPLQSVGVAHAHSSFLQTSTASFTIGATTNATSNFTGLIDEVRISDSKLTQNDLLIVPEPSTALLGALGALALLRRQRRS